MSHLVLLGWLAQDTSFLRTQQRQDYPHALLEVCWQPTILQVIWPVDVYSGGIQETQLGRTTQSPRLVEHLTLIEELDDNSLDEKWSERLLLDGLLKECRTKAEMGYIKSLSTEDLASSTFFQSSDDSRARTNYHTIMVILNLQCATSKQSIHIHIRSV